MNEYQIRIYTGPAWVKQYAETWHKALNHLPIVHYKVWSGTEHVYIEGVCATDGPDAVRWARQRTGANLVDIDSKRVA